MSRTLSVGGYRLSPVILYRTATVRNSRGLPICEACSSGGSQAVNVVHSTTLRYHKVLKVFYMGPKTRKRARLHARSQQSFLDASPGHRASMRSFVVEERRRVASQRAQAQCAHILVSLHRGARMSGAVSKQLLRRSSVAGDVPIFSKPVTSRLGPTDNQPTRYTIKRLG